MEQTRQPTGVSIIVIDDEPNMGLGLRKLLGIEGYDVEPFTDPVVGLERIKKARPDVVLVDLMMPRMSGMELLKHVHTLDPSIVVIMITAHGSIDTAVEAVKEGAYHYITKPFNTNELLMTIRKALSHRRLVAEKDKLSEQLSGPATEWRLIGDSAVMKRIREMIERVAPTDAIVLITGESGTGKELVARSVHHLSRRRDQHFVAINCASIPEPLLESELFGHEKGAFTGADKMKIGLFELAHQGTLFLDELGELPMSLQAKLLRALERREIQRVGGLRAIPIDIRLVTSTNRNLEKQVDDGKFRADLFFRLHVFHLETPPLRAHKEDIPQLVQHILKHLAVQFEKPLLSIEDDAIERLQAYWWPGNVRELQNVLERTVVLLDGTRIGAHNLPPDLGVSGEPRYAPQPSSLYQQPFRDAREQFEREYFERLLAASRGNVAEAARRSGISRRHFYEKIEKLGIASQQYGRQIRSDLDDLAGEDISPEI